MKKVLIVKLLIPGIGYKELYSYFKGDISLEEAVKLIKKKYETFY